MKIFKSRVDTSANLAKFLTELAEIKENVHVEASMVATIDHKLMEIIYSYDYPPKDVIELVRLIDENSYL
jgi:hypothetical protein